jgi:hypothetical protein
MKNIPASVRARLLLVAKQENKVFQHVLVRYFQERLLYRLSRMSAANHFCLKGGTLFYAWDGLMARPTKDLDLLGQRISNTPENILRIFKELAAFEFEQDGVYFDGDSLVLSEIVKDGNYHGIRVIIQAHLENIREKLQIDIGFGDVVIPTPELMTFPTLLDLDAPIILAYSPESVVAEKFHAMLDLGELNSRMKDFHDIHHLLKSGRLRPDLLEEAILTTLHRRGFVQKTDIPLFSPDFAYNPIRQKMWVAFLKKSNLPTTMALEDVLKVIVGALRPILEKI